MADITFSGNIDVGSLIGALVLLIAAAANWLRSDARAKETQNVVRDENALTRECIHQLPNHPENPNPAPTSNP